MAPRISGTLSAAPIQNRRVMSRSSGSGPSAPVAVRGSSAMPQIGHVPGPSRTICGCIGQVHVPSAAGGGADPAFAGVVAPV
jgi:hypothetical protein